MKKNKIYKTTYVVVLLLSIFYNDYLNAQTSKIDSLLVKIKNSKDDTLAVNILNEISWQYINVSNYEAAKKHALLAQNKAKKLNFNKGIANSYIFLGIISLYQGNYDKAMEYNLSSLKIKEQMGDKKGISKIYNNIGIIYRRQGNYKSALSNYFKFLMLCKELKDKKAEGMALNNIGLTYTNLRRFEKSIYYYLKSLKINEEINDKPGTGLAYLNIGNIYQEQMNYDKAMDYYLKSLKIHELLGDKRVTGITQNNMGRVYMKLGKFKESFEFLNKSLVTFKEIGSKDDIKEAYFSLADLNDKKGDFKQALLYHKLYTEIKDSLLNEQSSKQITEMNTKYESEKKEKDIALLTKDKNLQRAEIGKQKIIRNGSIAGLLLALVIAFILFNRFKVTNKQKKIIEKQNFQIVESINYSKKIQDSLLPSIESMQAAFSNIFVFYKPKAIVSGDFYYFREFEKHILLACVDCTGHGVPGGFMSTLGSLLLDKIANNERLTSSEILQKLSDEIIRVLHQQDGGEIQDGMDLSLCLIDRINRKVEFSGARNGIIVVSNNKASRYKADVLPVGGNYMKKGVPITRNFTTQTIEVKADDWIYMYTDGFIEQVGGLDSVPMSFTQFEHTLMAISKITNNDEKVIQLQKELDNWRNENERDDDVLIMGFQLI